MLENFIDEEVTWFLKKDFKYFKVNFEKTLSFSLFLSKRLFYRMPSFKKLFKQKCHHFGENKKNEFEN